jgi:hypothetical protein
MLLLGAVVLGLEVSVYAASQPADAQTPRGESEGPALPAPDAGETYRPQSFAEWQIEVAAAVREARRRLPHDPAAAEDLLEASRQRVQSSALAPTEKWRLERQLEATAGYARQLRELEQRNQAIRDRVRIERQGRAEADQIIGDEAEHFEQLLQEGRFAEAEALALDLWDLSPGNPAVEAMLGKLRFAPYQFDLPFGLLYPDSYVDPFAFDYYPYTVPWHNYRARVYIGPYLPPAPRWYGEERILPSEPAPQPAPRDSQPAPPDEPQADPAPESDPSSPSRTSI